MRLTGPVTVAPTNPSPKWQVQQARDALEVYYARFRGIALEPRPDIPKPHAGPPSAVLPKAPSAEPNPDASAARSIEEKAGYISAACGLSAVPATAVPATAGMR